MSLAYSRTKFPFWSAIIEQQHGGITVASSSSAFVEIQPPPGETWLVWIDVNLWTDAAYSTVGYYDYDGATRRAHRLTRTLGSYGYSFPNLGVLKVLTNSLYASLYIYNADSAESDAYYGYSGFKLSKPLWSLERLDSSRAWKRKPSEFSILPEVEALSDYIVDIYDDVQGRYRQAIICEENTPLAIDPRTNFPVERLTVICYVDDFINNILKPYKEGTLDLERTGWKKYFQRWREEGIKL